MVLRLIPSSFNQRLRLLPIRTQGKTADDPEEKDAGYAPLVIHSIHMTGVELQDEEGVNA